MPAKGSSERLERELDVLADRMSAHDEPLRASGRAVGLNTERVKTVFKIMRKRLGWQSD